MYTQDDFRNLLRKEVDGLRKEKFELQKKLQKATSNTNEFEADEVTGLVIKIEKVDFAIFKCCELIASLHFRLQSKRGE